MLRKSLFFFLAIQIQICFSCDDSDEAKERFLAITSADLEFDETRKMYFHRHPQTSDFTQKAVVQEEPKFIDDKYILIKFSSPSSQKSPPL